MSTAHKQIEQAVRKHKKGELIFSTDFRGMGSEAAIKMALGRLHKQGLIKRLAHGIYLLPKTDPLFGEISPAPEEVAEAIAKKDRVQIKPAGAYALHKLGLTTQVPTKLVYLTDGTTRQIKLGKTSIWCKATTQKKISYERPVQQPDRPGTGRAGH